MREGNDLFYNTYIAIYTYASTGNYSYTYACA